MRIILFACDSLTKHRYTFASMMLSAGENIMWVATQMGHVDTEMVMRTYGKWIPDNSLKLGYKPLNNWDRFLEPIAPLKPQELNNNYEKP